MAEHSRFLHRQLCHSCSNRETPPCNAFVGQYCDLCLGALLMPATGLVFGLLAFMQFINGFGKSDLQQAYYAGALCIYVRNAHWRPGMHVVEIEADTTDRSRLRTSPF